MNNYNRTHLEEIEFSSCGQTPGEVGAKVVDGRGGQSMGGTEKRADSAIIVLEIEMTLKGHQERNDRI